MPFPEEEKGEMEAVVQIFSLCYLLATMKLARFGRNKEGLIVAAGELKVFKILFLSVLLWT